MVSRSKMRICYSMIASRRAHYKYLRSRQICNLNSILCLVFLSSLLMVASMDAKKCYICGPYSDQPFIDNKVNISNVPASCDEFDRLMPDKKSQYEFQCPENHIGCLLRVGADYVQRTCSNIPVSECQTADRVHYCYCTKQDFCNGENAESIIEQLGDVDDGGERNDDSNRNNEDDKTFDDEDIASGSSESYDDEDYQEKSTTKRKSDTTEVTTLSVTTSRPTDFNGAVNFNLSYCLWTFLALVHLSIVLIYHK